MILAFGATVKPFMVLFRQFRASKQGVTAKNRFIATSPSQSHEIS